MLNCWTFREVFICSPFITVSSTVNPGDEENSAKGVATAKEAVQDVPGVVKATSDEIYSDKSKEAAQVLLTELM